MGADFGGVRVHTDAPSDELARYLQARAFTTGSDIVFRRGQYDPSSRAGQQLIGHELAHVVQQSAGDRTGGEVVQRSIGFEFETDWGVHGRPEPALKATGNQRLEKHTSYKKGSGFTVQVDEASRGFKAGYKGLARQIEFVVDLHPESVAGGRKLQRTMLRLLAEVALLEAAAAAQAPDQGFTYPGANRDMWVFPQAKTSAKAFVHARAQATAGFALPAFTQLATIPEATLQGTRRQRGFPYSHASRSATPAESPRRVRVGCGGGPDHPRREPGARRAGHAARALHQDLPRPRHSGRGLREGVPAPAREDPLRGDVPPTPARRATEVPRQRAAFVRLVLNQVNAGSPFQVAAGQEVIPQRL